MIAYVLFLWIGYYLNAPMWYWVLAGIGFLASILSFGLKMYKKGSEQ